MPKLQLALSLLVLAALIGVGAWFVSGILPDHAATEATTQGEIVTEEGSDKIAQGQATAIEDITQDFMEYYQEAVSNNDEEAARAARELLSERGHTVIDRDPTPIEGLKRFTRGLNAPQRVQVNETVKQSDEFAEVSTTWTYPDHALTRYFYFVIQQGVWKIDSIQEVEQ